MKMDLGVPKYMVVRSRNKRFGAKTCVISIINIIIINMIVEKHPYKKEKRENKRIKKRGKEERTKQKGTKKRKRFNLFCQ